MIRDDNDVLGFYLRAVLMVDCHCAEPVCGWWWTMIYGLFFGPQLLP